MSEKLITLKFGDDLLDVECREITIPTEEDNAAGVPPGYVRFTPAWGYDPGSRGHAPMVSEDNTVLVSDEHVAMVQWED